MPDSYHLLFTINYANSINLLSFAFLEVSVFVDFWYLFFDWLSRLENIGGFILLQFLENLLNKKGEMVVQGLFL